MPRCGEETPVVALMFRCIAHDAEDALVKRDSSACHCVFDVFDLPGRHAVVGLFNSPGVIRSAGLAARITSYYSYSLRYIELRFRSRLKIMSITAKLSVQRRTESGSKSCRKLRQKGLIPGSLYGHKEPPVSLSCGEANVMSAIRSGAHVLDIELDGSSTKALIREVQWDCLGNEVVHFDLMRVDPHERLTVEVHVELKGTAPGTLSGGVLDHTLRTLTIECPAIEIPDNIVVKIGGLEVGSMIHVRELEVPPNVKVLNHPESIVVRIAKPGEVPEAGAAAPGEEGPAQPEVIGRKPSEEEGEEESAEKEKKK